MYEPMEASTDPRLDGVPHHHFHHYPNSGPHRGDAGDGNLSLPPQASPLTNNVFATHASSVTIALADSSTGIDCGSFHKPSNSNNSTTTTTSNTPLLRPGSMVMMTLTEEDYQTQYWPKLKAAIDQLLNMKPGMYIPISYEQMYSCVYKCVCKQFSERLYNDLLNHLSSHMELLSAELSTHVAQNIQFIENFSFVMHQYLQALSGIVPIFNYMNRFYVENKLKTDLNEELRKLFRFRVVDVHIHALIKMLEEVSSIPFAVSPPTMASVIKNLYALNEDYSKLNPLLFARFLPNILPPTDPSLLEQYALEARQLQQHISDIGEFSSHDTSRKRVFEDDISVN